MRTALITGGGANVGRAIALRIAADPQVDRVVVNDIDSDLAATVAAEVSATGSASGVAAACDAADWDGVRQMFEAVGQVDILVNNAGLPPNARNSLRLHESEPENWMPYIELNLLGVLYATRCALPGMIERSWGRIITIASDAGRVGEPRSVAYSAGKAGGMGAMRAVAREVGKFGVTANSISLAGLRHGVEKAGLSDDQLSGMLKRYIVPRLGEGSDAAGAVAFLASDEASWISGQVLAVNGGYSVTQ